MKIQFVNGVYVPTKEFWNAWKIDKDKIREILYTNGCRFEKDAHGVLRIVNKNDIQLSLLEDADEQNVHHPAGDLIQPACISDFTKSKLYPYQVEDVQLGISAINKYKSLLLAHGMGVGKTAIAAAIAKELGLPTLVIAPKSTHGNWHKIAALFNLNCEVCNIEQLKNKTTAHFEYVERVKLNGKTFQYSLLQKNWIYIFDECHICGGDRTHNNKILKAVRSGGAHVILISATVADKPEKLDAIGYALGLHDGSHQGFSNFLISVGGRKRSSRFGIKWDFSIKTSERIRSAIFPPKRGLRKVAEEIAEIPENRIIIEYGELNGNAEKINSIYESLKARIEELKQQSASTMHILAEMTRYLQAVELQKISYLTEKIVNDIEEGMSVCVFMNYKESVFALSDALHAEGIDSYTLTGETQTRDRTAMMEGFQADLKRVFISTTAAGGAGISLHDIRGEFPRVSYVMPSFNSIIIKQALGRAGGRAGGKTKSITKLIFVKDTPEEAQGLALERKINFIDSLNDGDLQAGFNFQQIMSQSEATI